MLTIVAVGLYCLGMALAGVWIMLSKSELAEILDQRGCNGHSEAPILFCFCWPVFAAGLVAGTLACLYNRGYLTAWNELSERLYGEEEEE